MGELPSPGYYPDPQNGGQTYWDGTSWHTDMRKRGPWPQWAVITIALVTVLVAAILIDALLT